MTYKKASEVIKNLEKTNSRKEKENIIENAFYDGCFDFFEGALLAYDPLVTFGIKKTPDYPESSKSPNKKYVDVLAAFNNLAFNLKSRKLTGNAAKNAANKFVLTANKTDYEYFFRRVIEKDFNAGVSSKTINKVLKKISKNCKEANEYLIPEFECQLASDYLNHTQKLKETKIIEYKWDGVRLLTVVDFNNDLVLQFTRNGRVNRNFEQLTNEFQRNIKNLKKYNTHGLVFDGEVVSENFQNLMKQVNRKNGVDTNKAEYFVFDVVGLNEFKDKFDPTSNLTRLKNLENILNACDFSFVKNPESSVVDLNTEEGNKEYHELVDKASQNGLEGIMIKDAHAPYECKRGTNWLKQKPNLSLDLVVKEVLIGTGRNCTRLGAIVCEGEHEGDTIRVNVGSGFTDEQRDSFWANRENLLYQIVEVKADGITKNQNGTYSLRFPRFERFRGDVENGKI